MSGVEVAVVFALLWWVVLFTTLPFGVRRTERPDPGTEVGAPEHAHIGRKLLATTLITGAITAAIYVAAAAGLLPVRDWLAPEQPLAGRTGEISK